MSISLKQVASNNSGSSVTLANPVAVGDWIVACVQYYPSVGGTAGASDNVNTGSYVVSPLGTILLPSGVVGSTSIWIGAIRCNAAGTPTITGGGSNIQRISVHHFQGFVNTAQWATSDYNSATGTGTAVSSGTFSASQAGEWAFAYFVDSSNDHPTDSGVFGAPQTTLTWQCTYDFANGSDSASGATLSQSIGFSATLGASATWYAAVAGFVDHASTPPAIVQKSTLATGTGLTKSATLNGVTQGNTILALVSYVDTSNASNIPKDCYDAQGSYIIDGQKGTGDHNSVTIFKLANAASGTHTVTVDANSAASIAADVYWGVELWEIDATQYGSTPDPSVNASATANSTGPVTATTGVPSQAKTLMIGLAGTNNNATTGWQTATGWTTEENSGTGYPGFQAEYIELSSATAQSPNFAPTLSPACEWGLQIVGYPAVVPTSGTVQTVGSASGTSINTNAASASYNYTVPTGANCLVVSTTSDGTGASGVGSKPTSVTYNGVALTQVPSGSSVGGYNGTQEATLWYMLNPPVGSNYAIAANYPDTKQFIQLDA
ncbi:MAG: hypothetical protein KGL39_24650, partial [Patescibacteria group bacterium]|nr:hypothetical protein [Patescibacteria group bacterium]